MNTPADLLREEPILQFFDPSHLTSTYLHLVAKSYHTMAYEIVKTISRNPERTIALRRLLESKEAALRAVVYKEPSPAAQRQGVPQ